MSEPSQRQAAERTVAIACIGGAIAGYCLALSGVGGLRGGWVATALMGAAAGTAAGWFGWGRRGRSVAAAILAVAGVGLGLYVADHSVWSHGRMWSTIGSISVPAEFTKVVDREAGNSLCFDECSSVTRTWLVTSTPEQALAAIEERLAANGFTMEPWQGGPTTAGERARGGRRGRLSVSVKVFTTTNDAAHLGRVPVPSDRTTVELTLEQIAS